MLVWQQRYRRLGNRFPLAEMMVQEHTHGMDINEVFTRLKCLGGCSDCRRDKILARLGAFYLSALDGNPVEPPPLSEMLRGCCQLPIENVVGTYIPGDAHEQAKWEQQASSHKRGWRW
jgi:hypothetical protein